MDDLTVNVEHTLNLLNPYSRPSLVALVAYSFQHDMDLETFWKSLKDDGTDREGQTGLDNSCFQDLFCDILRVTIKIFWEILP